MGFFLHSNSCSFCLPNHDKNRATWFFKQCPGNTGNHFTCQSSASINSFYHNCCWQTPGININSFSYNKGHFFWLLHDHNHIPCLFVCSVNTFSASPGSNKHFVMFRILGTQVPLGLSMNWSLKSGPYSSNSLKNGAAAKSWASASPLENAISWKNENIEDCKNVLYSD